MKKIIAAFSLVLGLTVYSQRANAQLQEGNLMVGANLMNLDASFGDRSQFSMDITPKLGYFIKDNLVIGGQVALHYVTTKHLGSSYRYEVGAFGRYYFSPSEVAPLLNHGRFFGEANLGIGGDNNAPIGLSFGLGPGYSYFITPNIGLEALVKLHGIAGNGSSVGIGFGLGFQIYLPTSNAREMYNDVSKGSR